MPWCLRASASRPSGEWNDDDFDVLAHGVAIDRIFRRRAGGNAVGHRTASESCPMEKDYLVLKRASASVCRQSISDSWLGNLREYLAHLV